MSSPITTWDGATVYLTFADKTGLLYRFLLLMAAVTVSTIANSMLHERRSSRKLEGSGYS
jgi:chemotaxis protein CheY-P-specific phosphatase CheC